MTHLIALIDELEKHIPQNEMADPDVSKGTVGWHIAHSLLTINVVAEALAQSDPGQYSWKFDWRRSFVLAFGKIPRGKIKAPEVVRVKESPDQATLAAQVAATRERVAVLQGLQPRNFFLHPFIGKIKLKPAIRFLCVHTYHHLKIIRDLAAAQNKKAV